MMHEPEKSDPCIVAKKPANDGAGEKSESVGVRERARQQKKERFTTLLHHVDVDLLRAAFSWLKRDAAPGVDGLTWREYEQNLEVRLVELHAHVHRGAYRALPSRRKFINHPRWEPSA